MRKEKKEVQRRNKWEENSKMSEKPKYSVTFNIHKIVL